MLPDVLTPVNQARVQSLFRNGRATTEHVADVVPHLVAALDFGNGPDRTILDFAMAAAHADRLQTRVGAKQDVRTANTLVAMLGAATADRLPLTRDAFLAVDRVHQKLLESAPKNPEWWIHAFAKVKGPQAHRVNLSTQALEMFSPKVLATWDKLRPGVTAAMGGDFARLLDGDLSEVVAELATLRRYGVKPAIFRDGFGHGPNEGWAVMDESDFEDSLGRFTHPRHNLAQVFLTEGEVTSLSLTPNMTGERARLLPDFDYRYQLVIDRAGELHPGDRWGFVSARKVFDQTGLQDVYGLYALQQIMRVWDLVVPLEEVRQVKTWALPLHPGRLGKLAGAARFLRSMADLPELVVPRLRVLEDASGRLLDGVEREAESAIADTRARKPVGKHDVVGHKVTLPEGRRATPAACKLAQEAGVELAANETWRAKSTRGTGPVLPKGHRAVQRNSAPARTSSSDRRSPR